MAGWPGRRSGLRLKSTNWDDYDKQIGGALEFANMSRHPIELLQLWAYIKVFLWNRRFVDFMRFCWRYRLEGMVVARKVLLRRSEKLTGAGPAKRRRRARRPTRADIVAATTEWQDWQRVDMARMKKERPGRQSRLRRAAAKAAGGACDGALSRLQVCE